MKPKQLIILVVVLAVLAGLVYLRQSQDTPESLEEQYTLQTLMPQNLDVAGLSRIEMYAGAKPEEKVVLERQANGTKWTVVSKFGAPASQEKMDEYLGILKGLKGEFRATASGDALKDYSLDDAGGFHVLGYDAGSDAPALHLVSGKSPTFEKAFARAADSDQVYVIDVSLRREAGIYTVEMGDAPEGTHWLDKTVLELDSEKVKKAELVYPDKSIAFELQKKETPPAEAPPDGTAPESAETPAEAAGTPADGAASDPAPPAEIIEEWNWVVTQGGPGTEFHSNAAANLARRLARISATDVVDPEKKADWKLDPPQYRATVTVEGRESPLVIEAGRPAGDTYAYLRLPDSASDVVYKVSGYDFEQLFQSGGEYFELPGVLVEEKDVNSIQYTLGDRKVALSRDGETWKLTAPATGVAANQLAIDDLARALLAWKADDYADSADGKGFDGATDAITFAGPEASHTITLGGAAPGEGRYARLDDGGQTLVMSEADVAAVFAPYSKLFEMSLFDVEEPAIEKLTISKGEAEFELERTGDDGWNVVVGDVTESADASKVSNVLGALVTLRATDVDFPEARASGDVFGTVAMTLDDDTELKMTVERSADGEFAVTKPGSNAVYEVAATQISKIFADPSELKTAPPVAEPASEAGAPTDDSVPAVPDTAVPESTAEVPPQ